MDDALFDKPDGVKEKYSTFVWSTQMLQMPSDRLSANTSLIYFC